MRLKKQKQEKPLCQKIVIADKENDDPNCEFYYLKPAVLKTKEEEVHENEEEEDLEEEKKAEEEHKTHETEQILEENKDNKIIEIKANENSEEHKNNINVETRENETKSVEIPAKKEEIKENKTIYNPIRQPFCFIYQITKNQK